MFNPFKTGPSGEPIKNGLLGRFLTFRKDDGDVEYRPPFPPHPVQQGMKQSATFFCFSSIQDNDKKEPKLPVKPPCTDKSENAFKNSVGRLCWKLRQKMCARFKFFARRLFASFQYWARQWGGGRGGRNTARSEFHLGLSKYVWCKLGFILKSVQI